MTRTARKTPAETPKEKRRLENHKSYEKIILKRILNMKSEFNANADILDSQTQ